ncbi:hypothetical protein NDU88_004391 [Pleurodeles waltl]|uniref:Uncharacterized protein n=1 Tax=Pleurodeles waltl TaxID=8319 RepID=A0AAV7L0V3_PLEWA|nr:hypothetical protein NDU88_004391 [Pleurodeles waltl]
MEGWLSVSRRRNDLAWSDGFRITKEGLGDGEEKRRTDGHGGRQEGEEQLDAIPRVEDPRKMEEEKGRKNAAGTEPGTT